MLNLSVLFLVILSSLTLALENGNGKKLYLHQPSPKSVLIRFPPPPSASIKVSASGSKRQNISVFDQKPSETHEHGDHNHGHENYPQSQSHGHFGAGNHQFFQWMDTYLLQKGPGDYEAGHLSENPHGWELRFERVDGNVKQGKVKWGDKKGGYGESYWDYNHIDHKYNHQNDHQPHNIHNNNHHENHHNIHGHHDHGPNNQHHNHNNDHNHLENHHNIHSHHDHDHGPNQEYGESSPKNQKLVKVSNQNQAITKGLRKTRYSQVKNGLNGHVNVNHPQFKASKTSETDSSSSAILIVPSPKLVPPKTKSRFLFPIEQKRAEKSLINSPFNILKLKPQALN